MSSADFVRAAPTGISILIVGGGIAGLTLAIEALRQGHTVLSVLERHSHFDEIGDVLAITESAQRCWVNWPGFLDRVRTRAWIGGALSFHKYDGTLLAQLRGELSHDGLRMMGMWRAKLHEELYAYATEVGVGVEFDRRAVRYFEDEKHAYVETQNGQVYSADLIVAADGIGTKSLSVLPTKPETPEPSGYAIYRAGFPLDAAIHDPDIMSFWGNIEDGSQLWIAEDKHVVTTKNISYMMTHRETDDTAEEAWSATCDASNALPFVPVEEGWHPAVSALVRSTPNNRCINWKLVWRSPHPDWTSTGGRIQLIGDAAHPFVPTSGSGAVMAIEDAYSLSTCLSLAGKDNIPLALRAHTKMRFERVSQAQRLGVENREYYHQPDWEAFEKDPAAVAGLVPKWITSHDVYKYTQDNFDKATDAVRNGTPFKNTNGPPGVEYQDWTVKEITHDAFELRKQGKVLTSIVRNY
ncbi:FAD/NAD(P)-binding domain-containing protein [Cryphonectria parasitica EP155]|uniref:FAD/NAD(P)-binding domain-containing protein n=1 Tax=Cryphonectria parasitica (strain ATCC 38755 / EP155) TaxID=660469 RepID=A0A9P4XR02_CRYP1|nr:FAD/NAD(P)-binding domain-containing protein [Cryphonectria parasitica EP155]KAF3760042.1 FAD/NAD(P)-binding domain-containing protein [Cryphonectria parasitica EP155]